MDFTFIGNTLNLGENNVTPGCETLTITTSSATLNLAATQQIEKAYLYWAGSGTGDFDVTLNGVAISALRTFSLVHPLSSLAYFGGFAEVTTQVQNTGNGLYTLSDLDVSQTLLATPDYCSNRTDFAGWAMIVVYKDASLPINQINIYDGLQSVPNQIDISLNALNVIDNLGAKIAFIAWEGDAILAVNETLTFNGVPLSNSLNPANNQFNGTNTFAGTNTVYNMDLDEYDIQNLIAVGDTTAAIQMTSGQDFVMINAIVTKLNSQLPDATIQFQNVQKTCNSKIITADYTVFNTNATNPLPANTPIAVYANSQLVAQAFTQTIIPVGGSENSQITIALPLTIPINFQLQFVVDDVGTGQGTVAELNEINNTYSETIALWISPDYAVLTPLVSCNQGLTKGVFDFSDYANLVLTDASDQFVGFYESATDAANEINPITNSTHYVANTTPKAIFVKIKNQHCPAITSFLLETKNCPPIVHNFFSPNNDTVNDAFHVEGLRDVFLNFKVEIYNRWGRLIWTGTNQTNDWEGYSNTGFRFDQKDVPAGTYYYAIYLNDPDYPEPLVGWVYFDKKR